MGGEIHPTLNIGLESQIQKDQSHIDTQELQDFHGWVFALGMGFTG